MIPIYPISEETCKPHYGRYVYVVLQDGTQHIGVLSRVNGKQLILNEQELQETSVKQRKASLRSKKASIRKTGARGSKTFRLSSFAEDERGLGVPEGAEMPYSQPMPYQQPFPNPFVGERVAVDMASVSMLFLIVD